MFTSTLALLTRSLRVDARLLRHHLLRLLFVIVIYASVTYAHQLAAFFGAPGLQLFQSLAWMNLVFITLAGLGFFASAITEEKEEETLGLLKMAGVRPLSLLLGKSTSRLLTAGVLLSLQFPFTLLAIALGGVTIDQVVAVYFTLLAYLALVANLALFFSVCSQRTGGAAAGVFLSLLAFFALPPLLSSFFQWVIDGRGWTWMSGAAPALLAATEWLTSASAATRLWEILVARSSASPFGIQVISNFAAAAGLFLLSWLTFDRFTRTPPTAGPARSLLRLQANRLYGLVASRAWSRPLAWKDFHFVTGGRSMMLVKLIGYGLLLVLLAALQSRFNRRIDLRDLGEILMVCMLFAGMIELALMSNRIFDTEIRWRTWPTLRMLPTSLPRIIYAKVAGCLLALGPALVYLSLGVLLSRVRFFDDIVDDLLLEWGFWISLLLFALFLHLIALLSLYVKWGALPLAIGIFLFSYMFCGMGFAVIAFSFSFGPSAINEDVVLSILLFFLFALNAAFEIAIGLRLKQLAAR